MSLLVVGVSYQTAPMWLLERVHLDQGGMEKALLDLTSTDSISEAMVVSTCNRIEVYADADRFHPAVAEIGMLLSRVGDVGEVIADHCYVHYAEAAAQHLFSVASGLDSMVVGEAQILGQVRSAYTTAIDMNSVGPILHDLAQTALRVGKRVHSETGIDKAGQSIVSVALDGASSVLGDLAGKRAVIVGAGSMGSLAAATLYRAGVSDLVVVNRSPARAVTVAGGPTLRVEPMSMLAQEIGGADLVVSATGAAGLVIWPEHLAQRDLASPLVIADLAVPRDVHPAVAQLPGLHYLDIAALRTAGGVASSDDVNAAKGIVAQELGEYLAAQQRLALAPTISALRSRAGQVVESEVRRLLGRMPDLDPAVLREVEMTVRRAVDKVMHTPTVRVKELAGQPGGEGYAKALRVLFDLDPATVSAVGAVRPELYDPRDFLSRGQDDLPGVRPDRSAAPGSDRPGEWR